MRGHGPTTILAIAVRATFTRQLYHCASALRPIRLRKCDLARTPPAQKKQNRPALPRTQDLPEVGGGAEFFLKMCGARADGDYGLPFIDDQIANERGLDTNPTRKRGSALAYASG